MGNLLTPSTAAAAASAATAAASAAATTARAAATAVAAARRSLLTARSALHAPLPCLTGSAPAIHVTKCTARALRAGRALASSRPLGRPVGTPDTARATRPTSAADTARAAGTARPTSAADPARAAGTTRPTSAADAAHAAGTARPASAADTAHAAGTTGPTSTAHTAGTTRACRRPHRSAGYGDLPAARKARWPAGCACWQSTGPRTPAPAI